MKQIFRSIIDVRKDNHPTIDQNDLIQNYREFISSKVKVEDLSYNTLYRWVDAHYHEYNEMPSIFLLYAKAEEEGNKGVIASLRDLATETPFIRSDYKKILKEEV